MNDEDHKAIADSFIRLAKEQEVSMRYQGPRSICKCGHTGDGVDSEHDSIIHEEVSEWEPGCGECNICGCRGFKWVAFTDEFIAYRKEKMMEDTDDNES